MLCPSMTMAPPQIATFLSRMALPARIDRKSHRQEAGKRCPAHRNFVRSHACSACGSRAAIECAHVRDGTGGGMSMKPSDRWCISLCSLCHQEQHRLGEASFAARYKLDLKELAEAFAKASPHWPKLREMP
jgi:hypothetical protein